jgi:hypothetical protein
VEVENCSKEKMLSDFFTKPFQRSLFTKCQNMIMNISNKNDAASVKITEATQECVGGQRNVYNKDTKAQEYD